MTLRDRIGFGAGVTKLEDALEWAVANEFYFLDFNTDSGTHKRHRVSTEAIGSRREYRNRPPHTSESNRTDHMTYQLKSGFEDLSTFPPLAIVVMGLAGGVVRDEVRTALYDLGKEIGRRGYVVVTGSAA